MSTHIGIKYVDTKQLWTWDYNHGMMGAQSQIWVFLCKIYASHDYILMPHNINTHCLEILYMTFETHNHSFSFFT
jgi:hypothetical protein